MAVSQRINVTFRCHVGSFATDADLALPSRSTLDEVMDEVLRIIGAPPLTRPWAITTAAGTPLGRSLPLEDVVSHGELIYLSPAEDPAPPVIKDSAEALAATAGSGGAPGAAWAWSLAALSALALLASAYVPVAAAIAVAAALGFALALWVRPSPAVAGWIIAMAAAAGWTGISNWSASSDSTGGLLIHDVLEFLLPPTVVEAALGGAIACACAGLALAITHATGLVGPRTAAATLTAITITVAAVGGLFMPGPEDSPAPLVSAAAAALITGLILVAIAPGLTTRAAGLSVPRLPTAGQSLDISDALPTRVDLRALRAQALYDGLAFGLAAALIPAWAVLALAGSGLTAVWDGPFGISATTTGFAQGLSLAYAGAMVLHAARHASRFASWALSLIGLAAVVSAAVAAWLSRGEWSTTTGHIIWFVIAALALVAGVTAPLWAPRIPHLEPTTIVWFERAESLTIAASLPLAAHLLGLFMLIRGLG